MVYKKFVHKCKNTQILSAKYKLQIFTMTTGGLTKLAS